MAKTNAKKKKKVKVEAYGEAHIHASFNNIIISLTNNTGQVISWSSAGKMGFRGSKKNTPYAAQMAAEDCAKDKVYEFFFCAPPLPITKAVGSPINPMAIK